MILCSDAAVHFIDDCVFFFLPYKSGDCLWFHVVECWGSLLLFYAVELLNLSYEFAVFLSVPHFPCSDLTEGLFRALIALHAI